jgi:16S rRNA (uracil1498-N3)-methyltransferase
VPLESDRAVLHPGDGRLERWRRIAIEAAEQCGRAVVPTFEATPPRAALVLVADPGAASTPHEALSRAPGAFDSVAIYIGPEGGWTEAERAAHGTAGQLVSLGPRTLRVETAALVALALTLEALGGLAGRAG